MSTLDKLCRERAGKGEDWAPYSFQCLPRGGKNCTHIEIVGSRWVPIQRGPRKGQPRWISEDKATVILGIEEYRSCFPAKARGA